MPWNRGRYRSASLRNFRNRGSFGAAALLPSYLSPNLHRRLTLHDLSRICFVSEASLSRYIFKVTGLRLGELIQEMKLSKVRFLLLHTNLPLAEIAEILGSSHVSRLSRVLGDGLGHGGATVPALLPGHS